MVLGLVHPDDSVLQETHKTLRPCTPTNHMSAPDMAWRVCLPLPDTAQHARVRTARAMIVPDMALRTYVVSGHALAGA
eukprot:240349-Rhodomonas_salina.1